MTLNVSNDKVMLLYDQFLDPQFIQRKKKKRDLIELLTFIHIVLAVYYWGHDGYANTTRHTLSICIDVTCSNFTIIYCFHEISSLTLQTCIILLA